MNPFEPQFTQSICGSLVSRQNLLLFIREWLRVHEIEQIQAFEFGVLNGESAIQIVRALRGPLRRFTGFDTFEGLPNLDTLDELNVGDAPSFVPNNYASFWELPTTDRKKRTGEGGV